MARAACPGCLPDARRDLSGGFQDLAAESLPGAVKLWSAAAGSYPVVDLFRCGSCGLLWELQHEYPGRPPYMAWLLPLSSQDLGAALSGDAQSFVDVAHRRGPHVQLRGVLYGIALNADSNERRAMRGHPAFPPRLGEVWDRYALPGAPLSSC